MMDVETKEVRVNMDLATFKEGQILKLKFKNGVPVDRFWRRRLQDARIDNCVQVIEDAKPAKKLKGKKDDR